MSAGWGLVFRLATLLISWAFFYAWGRADGKRAERYRTVKEFMDRGVVLPSPMSRHTISYDPADRRAHERQAPGAPEIR